MKDNQREIREPWSFAVGAALVDITDDEIANWNALERRLVRRIDAHIAGDGFFPLSAVVLAHAHCFKDGPDHVRNQFHQRMPEAEQELAKELVSRLGPQRFGRPRLYGFHHEFHEGSLWNALRLLPSEDEEALTRLTAVLGRSEAAGVFERLSVIKHRIVGLFLPLDLRLQGGRALEIDLVASLDERGARARQLLEEARRILDDSGRRQEADRVQGILLLLNQAQPATKSSAGFHAWVQELEGSLHQLRTETLSS